MGRMGPGIALAIASLLSLLLAAGRVNGGTHQRRLLRELFITRGYNVLERPVENDTGTLNVTLKFFIQQIFDLDEKEQYLQSAMWIEINWSDYQMRWSPEDYGGIRKMRVPAAQVWRPDILMYNSADDKFDGTWATNVVIEHTGHMQHLPPAMLRSMCKVNIRWFPFDEQTCFLKFGAWTHDMSQVDLILESNEVDNSSYVENGEWRLAEAFVERHSVKYDCCPEHYVDVTVMLRIQRRALYFYFNLVLPCGIISAMALVVFTLPVECGEKMGLSVTIVLSLTVFMMVVTETVPRTSDAIPLLGLYFFCIMLISASRA